MANMDTIVIKKKVCCHKPPKHTRTHKYILLYTNTYIFIDKIITPAILVCIMCYACKLYTVYLKVFNIYSVNRPSEHPGLFSPYFFGL